MHRETVAKHVAHHKHVAVFVVHANPVHPQELGQQCVAMALHNVLGWKGGRKGKRLSSSGMGIQMLLFHRDSSREVTEAPKGCGDFLKMPLVSVQFLNHHLLSFIPYV